MGADPPPSTADLDEALAASAATRRALAESTGAADSRTTAALDHLDRALARLCGGSAPEPGREGTAAAGAPPPSGPVLPAEAPPPDPAAERARREQLMLQTHRPAGGPPDRASACARLLAAASTLRSAGGAAPAGASDTPLEEIEGVLAGPYFR